MKVNKIFFIVWSDIKYLKLDLTRKNMSMQKDLLSEKSMSCYFALELKTAK